LRHAPGAQSQEAVRFRPNLCFIEQAAFATAGFSGNQYNPALPASSLAQASSQHLKFVVSTEQNPAHDFLYPTPCEAIFERASQHDAVKQGGTSVRSCPIDGKHRPATFWPTATALSATPTLTSRDRIVPDYAHRQRLPIARSTSDR
jgi:hypothetical protein